MEPKPNSETQNMDAQRSAVSSTEGLDGVRRYRKKPVVIEALRFDGGNWKEIDWFLGNNATWQSVRDDTEVAIKTLEGIMIASCGDYIIKGVKGEFYPCKPDIFQATYEAV